MRRSAKWIVGIVALSALLLLCLWPALPRGVDSRRDRALVEIRAFATAVAMYEADTGISPASGLLAPGDSIDFGSRVISRLYPPVTVQASPVVLSAPRSGPKVYLADLADRLCILGILDPWGRPYRLAPTSQSVRAGGGAGPQGIVMWSVGRNGVDEGGKGDDVVDPLRRPEAPADAHH
jgi:hypothetical protein